MVSLAPHLKSLIKSMSAQPVDELILDSLIQKELNETSKKVSVENRKSQWEYLLKNEVFALAVRLLAGSLLKYHCPYIPESQTTEGKALKDPETKYYDVLRDRLDLVLTFTEHGL
jgi:THO complex subunit 1